MSTSRNIRFTNTAQLFIEKYQEQYGCSFNKAVNDLIEKAGSEAGKGKQRTQAMQKQVECMFKQVNTVAEQTESIFQWIQRHQ